MPIARDNLRNDKLIHDKQRNVDKRREWSQQGSVCHLGGWRAAMGT